MPSEAVQMQELEKRIVAEVNRDTVIDWKEIEEFT